MLISESSISENLTHIWLPLAEEASRKVLDKLGLTEYIGNNLYINSDYSGSSTSWRDKAKRYAMLNEQKFHVNVKFNNNTTGLKWDTIGVAQHMDTMVHRRDTINTPPLFFDKETGIHVIERMVPANIEMECQLVLSDSVVAFDTVTAILNSFNRGELMEVTDLSYDYPLPLSILKDLWILGQLKGIKPGCFMEWFKKCSNNAIQKIQSKRLNNQHHEIVVKKQIYQALMSIDYNADQPAIKSTGTNAEAVIISFNMTLQFSRPNMIYLKYPLVVNNKVVPEELIHLADDDFYRDLIYLLEHPVASYNKMYQHGKFLNTKYLHLPWYDNWTIPPHSQLAINESYPILIAALTLDNDKCQCCHYDKCDCECTAKYTKIDLYNDIEPLQLKFELKEYLLKRKQEILNADSLISITVFANDRQVDPKLLRFDGRYLEISNSLNPNKVYRLVLAITNQIKHGYYGLSKSYIEDGKEVVYRNNTGVDEVYTDGTFGYNVKKEYGVYPWLSVIDCLTVVDKEKGN